MHLVSPSFPSEEKVWEVNGTTDMKTIGLWLGLKREGTRCPHKDINVKSLHYST